VSVIFVKFNQDLNVFTNYITSPLYQISWKSISGSVVTRNSNSSLCVKNDVRRSGDEIPLIHTFLTKESLWRFNPQKRPQVRITMTDSGRRACLPVAAREISLFELGVKLQSGNPQGVNLVADLSLLIPHTNDFN